MKVRTFKLERKKSKPGDAVQRYGNWRKGTPTVLIDNHRWQMWGKPDSVTVTINTELDEPRKFPQGTFKSVGMIK